MFRLSQTESYF